jgi:hypothetical protein
MFIPDPDFFPSRIPDPWIKKQKKAPDSGFGSATPENIIPHRYVRNESRSHFTFSAWTGCGEIYGGSGKFSITIHALILLLSYH